MNPSYSEYVEVYVVPFHNSDQIHIQFKITLLSSKYLLTGSVIGYNSIIPKTELFPLHSQKQRFHVALFVNKCATVSQIITGHSIYMYIKKH